MTFKKKHRLRLFAWFLTFLMFININTFSYAYAENDLSEYITDSKLLDKDDNKLTDESVIGGDEQFFVEYDFSIEDTITSGSSFSMEVDDTLTLTGSSTVSVDNVDDDISKTWVDTDRGTIYLSFEGLNNSSINNVTGKIKVGVTKNSTLSDAPKIVFSNNARTYSSEADFNDYIEDVSVSADNKTLEDFSNVSSETSLKVIYNFEIEDSEASGSAF